MVRVLLFVSAILLLVAISIVPESVSAIDAGTTDVIVVGAGAAGSTFARRLHDLLAISSPDTCITVVTDGPEIPIESTAYYTESWRWNNLAAANWITNIPYNLHIKTVEQAQVKFRDQYIPHPKQAGGAQDFNGQVCQREEQLWWEAHATAVGDSFFGWESMLNHSVWIEDWKAADPYNIHGTGGPIAYHALSPGEPYATTVPNAMSSLLGIPIVNDTNGPLGPAVGLTVENIDVLPDGSPFRQVMYYKGLKPALGPTLNVVLNATVFDILYHPVHKAKAVGVKYFQNGDVYTLHATQMVVLAAGAVGTPKLAQLSGIGNCTYLVEVGVLETMSDCVLDQPAVGQNLKSQWTMSFTLEFPGLPAPTNNGSGFMARFRSQAAIANGDPIVDAMFTLGKLVASGGQPFGGFLVQQNRIYGPDGSVLVIDNDHHSTPLVTHNMYLNSSDVDTMVSLVQLARELFPLMGAVEVAPGTTSMPNTPGGIRTFITTNLLGTNSNYHIHGTMKMGVVVDTNFAVIGAKQLYVVDNSVCPIGQSAHAAQQTTMIYGALAAARIAPLIS